MEISLLDALVSFIALQGLDPSSIVFFDSAVALNSAVT